MEKHEIITKAKRRANKTKRNKLLRRLEIIAAAIVLIASLAITYLPFTPTWDDIYAAVGIQSEYKDEIDFNPEPLTVSFIDVGQGDSIFIWTENVSVLIDTGPEGNATKIVNYIKQFKIDHLDYLIITHDHDDHTGSLYELRKQIPITNEIIPDEKTIINQMTLTLDEDLTLTFLGPIYESEDINNMSLVTLLKYKDTSFLLMGDAEADEELSILRTYPDLKADVLKVGHHGSSSSTTPELLNQVQPKYAVISVGAGNDYGHPNKKTLQNLQYITTYRTDQNGTIAATSDGHTITFHTTYRQ